VRYTVVWTIPALSQLAACYNAAPHPNAVTAAQNRIDRLLLRNPLTNADEIAEELYGLNVPPLRAAFEVLDDDRLVRILGVSLLP
jgi:hypothetical protein